MMPRAPSPFNLKIAQMTLIPFNKTIISTKPYQKIRDTPQTLVTFVLKNLNSLFSLTKGMHINHWRALTSLLQSTHQDLTFTYNCKVVYRCIFFFQFQGQVAPTIADSQTKLGTKETAANLQTAYSMPCTLAQLQANEADVQAIAELTRALEKKVLPLAYA